MENKSETADFFLTKLTNYATLEDAYIYMKLAAALGLSVNSKTHEPICGNYGGIFMATDDNDYDITITLSGSKDDMDKFNNMWTNLDKDLLRIELDKCLRQNIFFE